MTDFEVHTESGHTYNVEADLHAEVGDWVLFIVQDAQVVAELRTEVIEAIYVHPQEDPEPLTVEKAFGVEA